MTIAGPPRSVAYCARGGAPACYLMPAYRKVLNANDWDAPTTVLSFFTTVPGQPVLVPLEAVPEGLVPET